jgi:hypothetical protein
MEELNIPALAVHDQKGYPPNYAVPLFSNGTGNRLPEIRGPQILPSK